MLTWGFTTSWFGLVPQLHYVLNRVIKSFVTHQAKTGKFPCPFLGILRKPEDIAALTYDFNKTCLTLNVSTLQQQTKHIVFSKGYDASVDVRLSGWGLVCAPDVCTERFPTQVFQQGRNRKFCVPGASFCLGASPCFLASSKPSPSNDWVTCQFRCQCPLIQSAILLSVTT